MAGSSGERQSILDHSTSGQVRKHLQSLSFSDTLIDKVVAAKELLNTTNRIAVLTGAGISTDSGIPDYRGPDGVWTKNPGAEAASTLQVFLKSCDARLAYWRSLESILIGPRPNAGHRALKKLQQTGRLCCLVTQNIDGLHQAAGHQEQEIVEVHGSLTRARCLFCLTSYPSAALLKEYQPPKDEAGRAAYDPRCPSCSGMLKPDVVLFGEELPKEKIQRAFDASSTCDVLLCVGTSLAVSPINQMVIHAKDAGATVLILNGESTCMDEMADLRIHAPISVALPVIVGEAMSTEGEDEGTKCDAALVESEVSQPMNFDGFKPTREADALETMDTMTAQAWMSGVKPPLLPDGHIDLFAGFGLQYL